MAYLDVNKTVVVRRFVPRVVIERFEGKSEFELENKEEIKSSNAAVGFFDIAGFSTFAANIEKKERGARQKRKQIENRYSSAANYTSASLGSGADALVQRLNNILRPLITEILCSNGDIVKFAGDALIVVWEGERKNLPALVAVATECAMNCTNIALIDFDFVHLHTGIGCGEILKCHVGGERNRWEFSIAGEANNQAANAEQAANTDDVVLSPASLWQMERLELAGVLQFKSLPAVKGGFVGYRKVTGINIINRYGPFKFPPRIEAHTVVTSPLRESIFNLAKAYIPRPVIEMVETDQSNIDVLLKVSVIFFQLLDVNVPTFDDTSFNQEEPEKEKSAETTPEEHRTDPAERPFGGISMEDVKDTPLSSKDIEARKKRRSFLASLQKNVKAVQRAAYSQFGTLRQFIIDDKGVVAIVVIGLPPHFFEDIAARAIKVAAHLIVSSQIRASAGISTGTVFCGAIGSDHRAEYSVTGECINLAARLMNKAEPNTALCEELTFHEAKLNPWVKFEKIEPLTLKGYDDPVPAFAPDLPALSMATNPAQRGVTSGSNVLEQLRLLDGRFAGINAIGQERAKEDIYRVVFQDDHNPAKAVFLEAPTGCGKTHMTHWALSNCPKELTHAFYTSGDPNELGTPFYVWRPILLDILKLEPRDDSPTDLLPNGTSASASTAASSNPATKIRTIQEIDLPAKQIDPNAESNSLEHTSLPQPLSTLSSATVPLSSSPSSTSTTNATVPAALSTSGQASTGSGSGSTASGSGSSKRHSLKSLFRSQHGSNMSATSEQGAIQRTSSGRRGSGATRSKESSDKESRRNRPKSQSYATSIGGNRAKSFQADDDAFAEYLDSDPEIVAPPPSSNTPKEGPLAKLSKISHVLTRSRSMGAGAPPPISYTSTPLQSPTQQPLPPPPALPLQQTQSSLIPASANAPVATAAPPTTLSVQGKSHRRNRTMENALPSSIGSTLPHSASSQDLATARKPRPLLQVNTDSDLPVFVGENVEDEELENGPATVLQRMQHVYFNTSSQLAAGSPSPKLPVSASSSNLESLMEDTSSATTGIPLAAWGRSSSRQTPPTPGSRLRAGSNASVFNQGMKSSAGGRFLFTSMHNDEQQHVAEQSLMLKRIKESGRVKYRRLSSLEHVLPGFLFPDDPDATMYSVERTRIRSGSDQSDGGILNAIKGGSLFRPGSPNSRPKKRLDTDDEMWDSTPSSLPSVDLKDLANFSPAQGRKLSQAEKEDIIELMLELLHETGKTGPTLIIIDDAHFMDEDSLELLKRAIEAGRAEMEAIQEDALAEYLDKAAAGVIKRNPRERTEAPNHGKKEKYSKRVKANTELNLVGPRVRFLVTLKASSDIKAMSPSWQALLKTCQEEHERVDPSTPFETPMFEEEGAEKEHEDPDAQTEEVDQPASTASQEDQLPKRPEWCLLSRLRPLGLRECAPFFSMHHAVGVGGDLVRFIHKAAEGKPGILLNLFNSLLEQQYIEIDRITGVATLLEGLNNVSPETVQMLGLSGHLIAEIYKHFANLPRNVQIVLKLASAIGKTVQIKMLYYLYARKHEFFHAMGSLSFMLDGARQGQDSPDLRSKGTNPQGNFEDIVVNPFDPTLRQDSDESNKDAVQVQSMGSGSGVRARKLSKGGASHGGGPGNSGSSSDPNTRGSSGMQTRRSIRNSLASAFSRRSSKRLSGSSSAGAQSEMVLSKEDEESLRVEFEEALRLLKEMDYVSESAPKPGKVSELEEDEEEIVFKRERERCVIYNMMLQEDKLNIHKCILEWYEEDEKNKGKSIKAERIGILGYHAMLSEQFLKAFAFFETGIEDSVKRYDYVAVECFAHSCREIADSVKFSRQISRFAREHDMDEKIIIGLFRARSCLTMAQYFLLERRFGDARRYSLLAKSYTIEYHDLKPKRYSGLRRFLPRSWVNKSQSVNDSFELCVKFHQLEEKTFKLLNARVHRKSSRIIDKIEALEIQEERMLQRIFKMFSHGLGV